MIQQTVNSKFETANSAEPGRAMERPRAVSWKFVGTPGPARSLGSQSLNSPAAYRPCVAVSSGFKRYLAAKKIIFGPRALFRDHLPSAQPEESREAELVASKPSTKTDIPDSFQLFTSCPIALQALAAEKSGHCPNYNPRPSSSIPLHPFNSALRIRHRNRTHFCTIFANHTCARPRSVARAAKVLKLKICT
jgi:hypothetical protein